MKIFLVLVLIAVLIFLFCLMYLAATDQMYKFWEIFRGRKRKILQVHMNNMAQLERDLDEIDDRKRANKNESSLLRQIKGFISNKLDESYIRTQGKNNFVAAKQFYTEYMNFCKEKKLNLLEAEVNFIHTLDYLEDELYPDTVVDRKLEREKTRYDETYNRVNKLGTNLHLTREKAAKAIAMTDSLLGSIDNIPLELKDDINYINDNRDLFIQKVEFAEQNYKKIADPKVVAGLGIAGGVAFAALAPSAAMWTATTFGVASTGTAIASLSGAAAENAALAWLGGGSLATGGGGMVAGKALLSLAGPIGIGIAGLFIAKALKNKSEKEELQRKKYKVLNDIRENNKTLDSLSCEIERLTKETDAMWASVGEQVNANASLRNKNYNEMTRLEKSQLHGMLSSSRKLAGLINCSVA